MDLIDVTLIERAEEGSGNVRLHLAPRTGTLPAFEPGAHIDLHLPGGLVRPYSLANTEPGQDHYLLCVKHEPASRGGSHLIHERLRPGDSLRISPPRNRFALLPGEHYVLIAAGIGITPLIAMASHLAGRASVELHYYTRSAREVAFRERLAEGFAGVTVFLHHSDQGLSPRQHSPAALSTPHPQGHVYLCGPEGFMAGMRARALEAGWPAERIHSEAFGATAVTGGEFNVRLGHGGRQVAVAEGQSIAQALMAQGIEVSVSCEQGFCGACITGLLAGDADHRDEVLGPQERTCSIALCCSRSRNGAELVLDL